MNARMRSILVLSVLLVAIVPATAQWVQTSFPHDTTVLSLVVKGARMFAGTYHAGLYSSTDDGHTWIQQNTGIPTTTDVQVLYINGSHFYAGTNSGLFRSTNDGQSWTSVNNGLASNAVASIVRGFNGYLFAGTHQGIYVSTNDGTVWNLHSTIRVYSLAFDGSNLFAGGDPWELGILFRSTHYGSPWLPCDTGVTGGLNIRAFAVSGDTLFAGSGHGIDLSTNDGNDWTNYGNVTDQVFCLARYGSTLFAGSNYYRVMMIHDTMSFFTNLAAGLPITASGLCLSVKDTTLFVGTNEHGIWRRSVVQLVPIELRSFTASMVDDRIVLSWKTESETDNYGFDIQRSREDGAAWETVGFVPGSGTTRQPRTYSYIDPLADGCAQSGILRYRLKQIDADGSFSYSPTVAVNLPNPGNVISLDMNYPNPTRSITTIRYTIPAAGHVQLRILNLLGQVVSSVVDAVQPAGSHSCTVNTGLFQNGVYVYELSVDGKAVQKKMEIVK